MREKISFIINIVLAVGIIFLLFNQTKKEVQQQPKINEDLNFTSEYLSPLIPLMDKENLLVNFIPLKNELSEVTNEYPEADVSIYFEYLNTGSNFSINGLQRRTPASLVKLPIAMIILQKVEQGELSLDQKVKIEDEFKDTSWGKLYNSPSGTELTIKELLEILLIESDNTAKLTLYQFVTDKDLDEIIDSIGVEDLFDDDGLVNVKEYSRLLRSLYTSSLLTPEHSEYLLETMSSSDRSLYLPNTLPEDVDVANKFGTDRGQKIFNDAGIVYLSDRPYLLVVLTSEKEPGEYSEEKAIEIMDKVSITVFEYVKGL